MVSRRTIRISREIASDLLNGAHLAGELCDRSRKLLTLIGSMIYQNEFPEALRLVDGGAVRTAPLITHRFGLDRIDEAFAAHADPSSIKVALEI